MEQRPSSTPRRQRTTQRAPAGYDADAFPRFAVTVDIVVLTVLGDAFQVLLVERAEEPHRGSWALPGGFKRPDETLDEAAMRELREETGLDAAGRLSQLAAYGDPGRDPRLNVVTIAYRAALPTIEGLRAGTDARHASVWPVADVLDGTVPLAFDHARIVRDTIDRTRIDLATTDLALAFVGPRFTLTELRSVFEAVWDTRIDPANFRRTLLAPERTFVEPTGQRSRPGHEGGRPPELYGAVQAAWREGAPLQRPKSVANRDANKKLFARIRSLRKAGRLEEALELVPPHWTGERAQILAALDEARVRGRG